MYQPINKLSPDKLRLFLEMTGWKRSPENDVGRWEAWCNTNGNLVSVAEGPETPHQEDFLWDALEYVLGSFALPLHRYDLLISFGKALEANRNAHE